MFKRLFEPLPLLTILSYELGPVLIIPDGSAMATIIFNEMILKVSPVSQKINQLRENLLSQNAKIKACELCDGKMKLEFSLHVPRLFPRRRIVSKTKRIMRFVADWAKPMTEVISDDVLGSLRWTNPDFEGRLHSGQSKIVTDLWIDLFVDSGGQPHQTLERIARLRQIVLSWGDWEPRIKKAILQSIYPEYHRWCDERQENIRHDESGFWSEFSVVSLSAKSDCSIVVRYHSGEMFGNYRVEAALLGSQINCRVTY